MCNIEHIFVHIYCIKSSGSLRVDKHTSIFLFFKLTRSIFKGKSIILVAQGIIL